MTFTDFIIQKYPLWGDRDLHHLHITIQQMIDLVDEWQQYQNNRKQEEKMRDAVNSMPSIFTQDNHLKTSG